MFIYWNILKVYVNLQVEIIVFSFEQTFICEKKGEAMACHQVKGQQRNGNKVYAEVGRKRNGKAASDSEYQAKLLKELGL